MRRPAGVIAAACFATLLATEASAADRRTAPPANDLTPTFRAAGFDIDGLQVFEVGGVVLIRGRSFDKPVAEEAGRFAQKLGYQRVANLIQVMAPPDDRQIERSAERELTIHRGLDGCKFVIESERGVVRLAGTIQHELQKDMALQLVRNLDGVREVRAAFERE